MHAALQQPAMAPPQAAPPPRPRNDPGAPAGASTSWRNWTDEAVANGYQPPPRAPATPYGQQHRVAFAGNESYAPPGDRAEMNPHAQRMIFESIINSRGGAPKQPQQQRSGRSTAQNSIHAPKQHKKSKREKRAQEQSPQNDWGGQQENPGWGRQEAGWPQQQQQDTGWPKKGSPEWAQPYAAPMAPAFPDGEGYNDSEEGAWNDVAGPTGDYAMAPGDPDGEGYIDSEEGSWNDEAGRRDFRRTVSSAFVPAPIGDSPYAMPSRTMAFANGNAQDTLDAISPGLSLLRESLEPVKNAFFGRDRKARDRIHWQFPYDKDERVRHALEWLNDHSHGIGAFGLNKFLQTRERGALFINASYDAPAGTGPAIDWLSYADVVETRDRLLQESVGFYDPALQVIVFVLLPSKSGNSLAMWRRKVPVPSSVRLSHVREIELAKAALQRDYPVLVDEFRPLPYRPTSLQSQKSVPPQLLPPLKPKKKKKGFFRKLFRIFKIVW
ncbi:hypothetical protein EI94DRAFT_1721669 [Lactarius quietus]|nr:hypothetical protein EI94DRAFT_1721669 [Lactarius quietus]